MTESITGEILLDVSVFSLAHMLTWKGRGLRVSVSLLGNAYIYQPWSERSDSPSPPPSRRMEVHSHWGEKKKKESSSNPGVIFGSERWTCQRPHKQEATHQMLLSSCFHPTSGNRKLRCSRRLKSCTFFSALSTTAFLMDPTQIITKPTNTFYQQHQAVIINSSAAFRNWRRIDTIKELFHSHQPINTSKSKISRFTVRSIHS